MGTGRAELPARGLRVQGREMLQAEEVAAMVRLHELGWGEPNSCRRSSAARATRSGATFAPGRGALPQPERKTAFDGLEDWLRERFFRHGGNADVIRQELESRHGIKICLRSVEKRVQCWRRS